MFKKNSVFKEKKNSAEISDFVWERKKEQVNMKPDLSILDKTKLYFPVSKKCRLCLTENCRIPFAKNLLNKCSELVTKCRHDTSK